MRRLRQLSMAIFLTLMLGTYALAGIIETPPVPPPPPAAAPDTSETATNAAQPVAPATDPVVEIALDLLQSALWLF